MSEEPKEKPHLLKRAFIHVRDFALWAMRSLGDPAVRAAVLADAGAPVVRTTEGGGKTLTFKQADPHFAGIDAYLKTVNPDREAFLTALADAKALIRTLKSELANIEADAGAEHHLDAVVQILALNFVFRRWPVLYWIGQPLGFFADLAQADPVLAKLGDGIVAFFQDKPGGTRLRDDWPAALAVAAAVAAERASKQDQFQFRLLYGWEGGPDSATPIADQLARRALSVAMGVEPDQQGGDLAAGGSITITLIHVPPGVGQPGTLISIAGTGALQKEIVPGWMLKAELRGGQAFDLYVPEQGDVTVNGPDDARAEISWTRQPDPSGALAVLPIRGGTRFEFNHALASIAVSRSGLEARLATEKAVFVLESGDDPLLQRGLKAGAVRTEFDLGLGFANGKPFIEGGAGLQATVPALKVLGPVSVQSVTLALKTASQPNEPDLALEVSVTFVVKLGPVALTVDRVGARARLDFGRGAGEADADVDLQAPKGVGLKIESSVIEGGGYIFRDETLDQYAGVIELKLRGGINLKAIALLTKRIAGQPAFSLLLIITAEGFRPLPLGLGFKLTGIGGIFGVDRTINVPALEAGVKTNALDALLFPNDPVANAGRIVATAGAVFPPMRDRCVFGPMVRIKWGADENVVLDLAVLVEFGRTLKRVAILGKARTVFPREDKAILKLAVDLVGTIDLEARRAFAHAVITLGELGAFKLSGEAAFLYTWGARPSFLFSVGGFNPRYERPEGFPALERVKFSLARKEKLTVDATFYVAVTSNSFQVGGSIDLIAKKSKFTLKGGIAIDALIQSQQPAYAFDLRANLELQVGGTPLFAVRLNGTLLGDKPWSISGKATFEIWIFDYTVDFSHTWGDRAGAEPSAPAIEVAPEVLAALADQRNWSVELPASTRSPVTLRRASSAQTRLHPLGSLSVTQRVVPLETPLARRGQSRVRGQSLFRIERLAIAGTPVATDPVSEPFPPAEFLDLSEDEKLSSPAFETMPCGVRGKAAPLAQGEGVDAPADYLTSVYDPRSGRAEPLRPPAGLGDRVRPVFRADRGVAAPAGPSKAVRLGAFSWTLATTTTLESVAEERPQKMAPTFTASLAQLKSRRAAARADLQLLPATTSR